MGGRRRKHTVVAGRRRKHTVVAGRRRRSHKGGNHMPGHMSY
jgi:hypothetical protein